MSTTWKYLNCAAQFLLIALLLSSLSLSSREAQAKEAMFFILDCSGSMWGRVDNQAKIVTAKEILSSLLKEIPETVDVGLMAYGHRKKGDCRDIEVIAAAGESVSDLLPRVSRLNALGRTPISDALLLAGKQLLGREDQTTLILISDGLETCQGDPCAVAAKLKEQGLNLVLHVVGFDVGRKEIDQLSCIARAGGGQFFQADSIDQLQKILTEVKAETVDKTPLSPPPPPPDKPVVADSSSTSRTIHIAGPGTVLLKPAPWVIMPPRNWALTDVETGVVKASGSGVRQRVPAGQYQIRWRQSEHKHGDTQLTALVKVESAKTVEALIDTGIRLTAPQGIAPPYSWGLIMPGTETVFWKTQELGIGQVVPAGTYQLFWQQKQHGSDPVILQTVDIADGQLNDIVLDTGIILQAADWLQGNPYYCRLLDENGKQAASWDEYAVQLTAPGSYTLIIRPTQHHHNDIIWGPVTIREHQFTEIPLNSGIQFNHDSKGRPPYHIFLVNIGTGKEIAAKETWGPIPAPPGSYRLDWQETQHGSSRQTLVEEFSLEAGVLLEVDI